MHSEKGACGRPFYLPGSRLDILLLKWTIEQNRNNQGVIDSATTLNALRRRISVLDKGRGREARGYVTTGHAGLDGALGGGLARGRLHEVFAPDAEDAVAACGFALLLALRAGVKAGPLLWLRTDGASRRSGMPYGPGLVEIGIDPAALLLGVMPDEAMLLRGAIDALRCPALGAVVVECWGNPAILDLTASRRLTLAAEASGVTAFFLRPDGEPTPSSADTRWQVSAAPSTPLPANAPGSTTFDINLLRRRAGPDGMTWRLEWNRDRGCFTEPALPGAVVSLPAAGPLADRSTRSVGFAA